MMTLDAVQFRTDTNIGGPRSIVFDSTGNAFIASEYWNLILKVDTSGNVTRWSGTYGITVEIMVKFLRQLTMGPT